MFLSALTLVLFWFRVPFLPAFGIFLLAWMYIRIRWFVRRERPCDCASCTNERYQRTGR